MYPFFESICFYKGNYERLDYHQDRLNRTFRQHYPRNKPLIIKHLLPDLDVNEKYKVRFSYNEESAHVEFVTYQRRPIERLVAVVANELSYDFKWTERSRLHHPTDTRTEIVFVKKGNITDASHANMVFYDGQRWVTPDTPLLPGTRRACLLDEGLIEARRIPYMEINKYRQVGMINAMIDLGELVLPIDCFMGT